MKIAQVLLSLILSLALLACSHNSGNVNENHKEQQLLLSKHISNEQINGFMEDRFSALSVDSTNMMATPFTNIIASTTASDCPTTT